MEKRNLLKISISGVRGIIGSSFTPEVACRFAQAFGTSLGKGMVIVGRDTRPSGMMIQEAVHAGLQAAGCKPVDVGILPTPSVLMNVRYRHAAGGICITASHNPNEWNALKFINSQGIFLNRIQAAELLDIYNQEEFHTVGNAEIRSVRHYDDGFRIHQQRLETFLDVEAIRQAGLRVAVDCCNGAASRYSVPFLESLGCTCFPLFADNSGLFPHPPEPTPENVAQICEHVRQCRADIGFVQDPDADRLLLIDETGSPIGEDYTLTIAAKYLLSKQPAGQTVVANLAITRAFNDVAREAGATCILTAIGEINVSEEIIARNAIIGGEGNGGVIVPAVHPCRDSFVGMGLILEAMATRGRTPSQLLQEVPQYVMIKKKFDMSATQTHRVLEGLRRHDWGGEVTVNLLDGVRLDWPDRWALIRSSNTEPVIRIAAEAKTPAGAEELIERLYKLAMTF
jgi:phosphomannomutase